MKRKIPGVNLLKTKEGRRIVFDAGLQLEVFHNFLQAMQDEGLEFNLYDPMYPSPSDPGAYFSYSPYNGTWRMTLGNHGWTGGIYTIQSSTLAKQLHSLHSTGRLEPLGLDNVCFFSHYEMKSDAKSEEENALLERIHA